MPDKKMQLLLGAALIAHSKDPDCVVRYLPPLGRQFRERSLGTVGSNLWPAGPALMSSSNYPDCPVRDLPPLGRQFRE